jgi:asparagine synthase (glutamine-hydrolysing)
MGNTDNMRIMAVLTMQVLHQKFVRDWRAPEPAPPEPVTVFDRTTSSAQGETT